MQEQLSGVPIQEELMTLSFRVDITEVENASLHARIKTMEAIEKITRNRERHVHNKMEQQLAAVQESQRQDRENFRKLEEKSNYIDEFWVNDIHLDIDRVPKVLLNRDRNNSKNPFENVIVENGYSLALKSKEMRECCFVIKRDAWLRGEFTLSLLDVLQGFSFFLQMGLTLILATIDGLDVGLLGDVIGEDDCDDDG
nr:hypothetical protein [Tanacetum cinerariifolium]